MTDDNDKNESITSGTEEEIDPSDYDEWYEGDVKQLLKGLHLRLDRIESAQHEHTQVLRTVMVGWNAFLKSAEHQLKWLFKGNIPQPILKRLIQTAFKGVEDMERKNK